MSMKERIGYTLVPVLCILASVVLVGAIISPMLAQQFGHAFAVQFIVTLMSLIAAALAVAMTVILQVQFLQHKVAPTNQSRWWHLYFGSAAALAGFVLAFMICISECVGWVEFVFLVVAAISPCALARYEDSGITFDVATRHSYGMLFGIIFITPMLLVEIL